MSESGQTRPSRAIGDMSPIPPLTAVMLQRNERQKRVRKGREQTQQIAPLFDQLVGEQLNRIGHVEAKCPGRLQGVTGAPSDH